MLARSIDGAAVFVCSSDSRKDILQRILPSLAKYWPDCPYPIYVGLNKQFASGKRITTLHAPESEWRKECLAQVQQIPATNLIVILDDFLFHDFVDQNRIASYLEETLALNIPYLRLTPLGQSLAVKIYSLFRRQSTSRIVAIRHGRPFYSSLQIALWNKEHFCTLLESCGSIWEFEHQEKFGVVHYAISSDPPIKYTHLVEKGRWQPYANALLQRVGLPTDLGVRPIWSKWMNLRLAMGRLRFHLLGYSELG